MSDVETTARDGAPARVAGVVVPGQRLGRYIVVEKIGQGGMGTVWSARDDRLQRVFALKVLRTDHDDPVHRARVLREAQSLARLASPHVVPVYDVGIDFGLLWVAMQLVRGVTVAQWLDSPRPWSQVIDVFVQAGRGLAAAHAAGLVHRDFKPGNAMIEQESGRVMVLDFGLAWAPGVEGARASTPPTASTSDDVTAPLRKAAGSRGSGRDPLAYTLTASDAVVGTPPYMAPEQHASHEVDARTDQYALCVSMFEGVFGRRPFRGDLALLLAAKLEGPPQRPRQPALPEATWRIIARGMATDPTARWPDLTTMIAAIERARRPRRIGLWALAGATLVLGGAAAAMPVETRDPCASAGASLGRAWNEQRRAELVGGFAGSERSGARDAADRVAHGLDAAIARWQAQARAACQAAHDDPDFDPTPTLGCVDRAALAVAAALEVLEQPDDARIARAARMIQSTAARNDCADPTADTPTLDAELARMHERARALMTAGALPDARAAGHELMREASLRGDELALARGLLVVGGASMDLGEWDEAQQRLTDALWTATAAGDDEAITTASTKLIELCAYRYDPECAQPWIRNAEAGLARQGDRGGAARSELELAKGDVVLREGDADGAIEHYQRALDGRIEIGGEEQLVVAVLLRAIGSAHAQAGRHAQALASYQRAAVLEARLVGVRDSGRATALELTAGSLLALGRTAEARASMEAALALVDAAYGEQHRHAIRMRGNLVLILCDAGELDDALVLAERVVVLKRAVFGDDDVQVAMALHNRGMVHGLRGDADAACRDHAAALELWERALGPDHVDLVHPLAGLAHCERARQAGDAALEAGERAERVLRASGREPDAELASDLVWARGATRPDARSGSDRTDPRTHAP